MSDKKKRVFHVIFCVPYEGGLYSFGSCSYLTTNGLGITEYDLEKLKEGIKADCTKRAPLRVFFDPVILSWQEFDYIPEEV